MSGFAKLVGSALVALLVYVYIGPLIRARHADRVDEPVRVEAVEVQPELSPTEAADMPMQAAVRPVEPSEGGGVPTLPLVAVGVALIGAAGVLLARRRNGDTPLAEVEVQQDWHAVLYSGEYPVRRGLLRWPAASAEVIEAEVIRRAAGLYPNLTCVAEPAARWAVYAGAKVVAEGVVGLDGETAEDRALEVLDQLVADRNLSPVEVRGLRCRVFGPDGVGEVDGRDW